jgi:hypothetical protein
MPFSTLGCFVDTSYLSEVCRRHRFRNWPQNQRRGALAQFIVPMISGLVDLDRGGHSGHENDALRHLIDVDAHGESLREPHPGEDRIDDGNALPVRLCIGDVDLTGDANDVATHSRAVTHQLDFGRIPHVDLRDVGLLEI